MTEFQSATKQTKTIRFSLGKPLHSPFMVSQRYSSYAAVMLFMLWNHFYTGMESHTTLGELYYMMRTEHVVGSHHHQSVKVGYPC